MALNVQMLTGAVIAVLMAGAVAAQTGTFNAPVPPLSDTRLAVSTLVREDLFAGFLQNDMVHFQRGEASLEKLYADRPDQRAVTRVWQAGAKIYRAVVAREAGRTADYTRLLAEANAYFDDADALKSPDITVQAVGGGVGAFFNDRLAPADRAAAWQRTYGYYDTVVTKQETVAARLPVHLRGESYGGIVTAAQRTGRDAEAAAWLDKMLPLVKDTPYEEQALKWKADMKIAPTTNLTCKNCHDVNRLEPTMQRVAAAAAKAATP